jgi:hypothetical protein
MCGFRPMEPTHNPQTMYNRHSHSGDRHSVDNESPIRPSLQRVLMCMCWWSRMNAR